MKPLSLLKDEDSSEKNVSSLNGFETCLISHLGIKDAAELVDNSKLKDRDASHIVRAYLMCSSDHKESKNRIHEVAASLGISTHSVSSLKAWISYGERGKRELGELSERELEDIQEYLKGNFTPFEEALLLLELRDLYGVSLAALKEVLISNDATSDNDSCLMKVEGQGEAIKVEEDHVKGIDVEVSDGRGDTVSYDNPLKIMWRQTWIDFLVRRTSEKMRSKMKILTLPGMNCLNIPGYLEAGFRAENIIGVEGSTRSDVRRKFEENAKFLGIRPVIGRLENILPDMKEKLDVVELDFHGQISASKEEIFRQLPLSEFSWVMINLMAKREGKDFQNHMRDFDALAKTADQQFDAYKRMVISELLGDLDASGSGETMLQLMDERGDIVRQQVHVGELRDAGYFDLFAETVGLKRREDWVDQDVFDGFPSQFTLSEWPSWIDRDIFCFEKIALMDHRSSSHLLRKSLMNSSLLEIPLNPRLARAYSQFCFDVAGLYNPLLSSSPLCPAPLKSFDPVIAGLISKMVFHLPTAEPVISDLEK